MTPLDPAVVVESLKNLRQPTVNLDSVYGDGPTFDPSAPTQAGRMYDGIQAEGRKRRPGSGDPRRSKFRLRETIREICRALDR